MGIDEFAKEVQEKAEEVAAQIQEKAPDVIDDVTKSAGVFVENAKEFVGEAGAKVQETIDSFQKKDDASDEEKKADQ